MRTGKQLTFLLLIIVFSAIFIAAEDNSVYCLSPKTNIEKVIDHNNQLENESLKNEILALLKDKLRFLQGLDLQTTLTTIDDNLTPMHRLMISELSEKKLLALKKEWEEGERSFNNSVLEQYLAKRFSAENVSSALWQSKSYEEKFIAEVNRSLSEKSSPSIIVKASIEKGRIYGGDILERGLSKQKLSSLVSSTYHDCVIQNFRLSKKGGLFFSKQSYWDSLRGYENSLVNIQIRSGKVTAVYDEDGEQLYPLLEETALTAYKENTAGEKENLGLYSSKFHLSKKIRTDSRFRGAVITDFPLTKSSVFKFIGLEKQFEKSRKKVDVVISDNSPAEDPYVDKILSLNGEVIYSKEQDSKIHIYKDGYLTGSGVRVGGQIVGSFTKNSLKSKLAKIPDCVLENFQLAENGKCIVSGQTLWDSISGYKKGDKVTIQLKAGKVHKVFDLSGNMLFPKTIKPEIWQGIEFRNGKPIYSTGKKVEEFSGKLTLNAALKNKKEYQNCIIRNFTLGEQTGKFSFLGDVIWPDKEGYEAAVLTLVIENGKLAKAYDSKNNQLFPLKGDKTEIWLDADVDEKGAIVSGKGKKLGVYHHKNALNSVLRDLSLTGNCVIRYFRLGEATGKFKFLGKNFWQRKANHEGATITIVRRNGVVAEVYSEKTGEKLYPYEGNDNEIWVEAELKNGKHIPGTGRKIGAYKTKTSLTNKIQNSKDFSDCIIKNVRLKSASGNSEGSLHILGKILWHSMEGYAGKKVTVVVENKEPVKVFDEEGKQLYPHVGGENEIWLDVKFKDGHIQDGSGYKATSFSTKQNLVKEINNNSSYKNCVAKRISPGESSFFFLGKKLLSKAMAQKYSEVNIVIEDGEPLAVFDADSDKQLYPYLGTENQLWLGTELKNGKPVAGKGIRVGAFRTKVSLLHTMKTHPEYQNSMIINFRLGESSGQFSFMGETLWSSKAGYAGELVNVVIENGHVEAVYDKNGKKLYQRQDTGNAEAIINRLYENGDFEKLLLLFGVNATNRILRGIIGKDKVDFNTVIKQSFHFFDQLPHSKQEKIFNRDITNNTKKFIDDLKNIHIFKEVNEHEILTDELSRALYRLMVKDANFLSVLAKESRNKRISSTIRKAITGTYRYYIKFAEDDYSMELKTPLKYYQKEGSRLIIDKKRIILADEPGLGKTLQVLAATAKERSKKGTCKTLIISPFISKTNVWKKQITTHLKGEPSVFVVNTRKQLESTKNLRKIKNAEYVIINYELLRGDEAKEVRDFLASLNFNFVAIDEAHRMRNDSQMTEAIIDFDEKTSPEYKVLITGTPLIGRRPARLYNLYAWVRPDLFPSRLEFLSFFRTKADVERLKAISSEFTLRRYVYDVLPELTRQSIEVRHLPLTKEQQDLYSLIENSLYKNSKDSGMIGDFISLKQAAISTSLIPRYEFKSVDSPAESFELLPGQHHVTIAGQRYRVNKEFKNFQRILVLSNNKEELHIGNGELLQKAGKTFRLKISKRETVSNKYLELDNIVERVLLKEQEKLVVFTGFMDAIEDLKERYGKKGFRIMDFHGRLKRKQKEEVLEDFNNIDEPVLLLVSQQAAGESIGLTGAKYGVSLDQPWTYQERDSLIRRLSRLGQKEVVKFWILSSQCSIDRHLENILTKGYFWQRMIFNDLDWEEVTANSKNPLSLRVSDEIVDLMTISREQSLTDTKLPAELFQDDTYISFKEGVLSARLINNDGEELYIENLSGLFQEAGTLTDSSKELVKKYLTSRIMAERKSNIPVKQRILWQMMDTMIPNFKHIDYDGRLEFMVELGSYLLAELIENPSLGFYDILDKTKVREAFLEQTLYYLDGANIFKLFSFLNLLPKTYYFNGELVEYNSPIKIYYHSEGIKYFDRWIIDQIAKNVRKRDLSEEEELRIMKQVELGNVAAEELLLEKYSSEIEKISKQAKYSVDRKLGSKINTDDIVALAYEKLWEYLGRFIENAVYTRSSFQDYLKQELAPKLYSEAYKLAAQQREIILDRPLDRFSDGGAAMIDVLVQERENPSVILDHKERESSVRDLFRKTLSTDRFSTLQKELLEALHLDDNSREDLKKQFNIDDFLIEKTVEDFLEHLEENFGGLNGMQRMLAVDSDEDLIGSYNYKQVGGALSLETVNLLEAQRKGLIFKFNKIRASEYKVINFDWDNNVRAETIKVKLHYSKELPENIHAWNLGRDWQGEFLLVVNAQRQYTQKELAELVYHEYLELRYIEELKAEMKLKQGNSKILSEELDLLRREAHILASYHHSQRGFALRSDIEKFSVKNMAADFLLDRYINFSDLSAGEIVSKLFAIIENFAASELLLNGVPQGSLKNSLIELAASKMMKEKDQNFFTKEGLQAIKEAA